MGLRAGKVIVSCLLLLACVRGLAQTGFYLTYPCKGGDAAITKIDRTRKGLCIAPNPIVSVSDLQSVSRPVEFGNQLVFDIYLTEKGFRKLEQVYPISEYIVFMIQDQAVFMMDTKTHRLAGTIRVQVIGRKEVAAMRALLADEIAKEANRE